MKTYEVLKKEYAIETLAKGNEVLVVDFQTMRVMSCLEMTVNMINYYKDKDDTVFYKVVINE
jgi:hypothetical protein